MPSWDLNEREMRVNFCKLNWSTEELRIILTLEWRPRRVAGGGGVHVTLTMIKIAWGEKGNCFNKSTLTLLNNLS